MRKTTGQLGKSEAAANLRFAYWKKAYLLVVLSCILALAGTPSLAQSMAGKPRVYRSPHYDVSPPLRQMKPSTTPSVLREEEAKEEDQQQQELEEMGHGGNQLPVSAQPQAVAKLTDRVSQSSKGRTLQLSAGLNFDGIPANGWAAPDTNGAVGATQYVQYVNNRFAVYDKASGNLVYGPVLENTLWAGFGGLCASDNSGDVIAEYDKAAGSWVMTHHATQSGGPNYQCVAVSTTSDATGSYYRYAFQLPTNNFPDYPKLSVWPDGYYLSTNLTTPKGSFINAAVCALDRNSMLSGAPATAVCFQLSSSAYSSLLPADLDGATPPPAGSPNYFLNLDPNNQSLDIWQFHVDFNTPTNSTFTGPLNIPVTPFNRPCGGGANTVCIPQPGTAQLVDSLGDRLMWRSAYRNFGDHDTLVVTHSVVGGSGSVGVRWYEVRNPGATPTVYQQSTFAPDANFRWMGSLAMDQMGDMALGYSESSSSVNPAVYYTGRLAADTLGIMENEALLIAGAGVEQGSNRWGDYSAMTIDPVDDCTFWYTNQYFVVNGSANWHTRIGSFNFSACPGVAVSPDNLSFPSQLVGTTSLPQTVTLINKQSTAVSIANVGFSGPNSADFGQTNNCGTSLAAGANCVIIVVFTPSATGTRNATLNVTDSANNSPQMVSVAGIGVTTPITLSPSQLSFPAQAMGTTSTPLNVQVSNSSAQAVTFNAVSASGNYGESDTCSGNTLQPSQTCNVSATFSPAWWGSVAGALTISDTANGSPQVLGLSGSGVKPLSISPATLSFGTTTVGNSSSPRTTTLTNNGGSPLNLTFSASGEYSAAGSGNKPCRTTLAGNASCTLAVTFSPTTSGTINGSVTVSYGAALSPQLVSLTGTGSGGATPPLSFSPSSLSFGEIAAGSASVGRTVTATNNGSTPLNISSLAAGGNFSVVPSGASPCGGPLGAGSSCTFSVTFAPVSAGGMKSAVTVIDNASVSLQVLNLAGTGVFPIALSPSSLTFAAQNVGTTSAPQIVTLSNDQKSSLSLSFTASGDYGIQTGGSNPCGDSIPSLGQCTVGVTFSPSQAGTIPGVVTFSYSGSFSPQELPLTGTGQ